MGICCLAPALTGWDYENGFAAEREHDFLPNAIIRLLFCLRSLSKINFGRFGLNKVIHKLDN